MARLTFPKLLDLALTDPDALDPRALEHAGRTPAGEIRKAAVARLMLLAEITSCSGPCSAREARFRLSRVRRTPGFTSGCRCIISWNSPDGRMPGLLSRIGTTSVSKMSARRSALPWASTGTGVSSPCRRSHRDVIVGLRARRRSSRLVAWCPLDHNRPTPPARSRSRNRRRQNIWLAYGL